MYNFFTAILTSGDRGIKIHAMGACEQSAERLEREADERDEAGDPLGAALLRHQATELLARAQVRLGVPRPALAPVRRTAA